MSNKTSYELQLESRLKTLKAESQENAIKAWHDKNPIDWAAVETARVENELPSRAELDEKTL